MVDASIALEVILLYGGFTKIFHMDLRKDCHLKKTGELVFLSEKQMSSLLGVPVFLFHK
jgi:hypothetical protein